MHWIRQRFHSWKEIFWRKAVALIAGAWFVIGVWDLIKSELLPDRYQALTVVKMTPHMQWRTWLIVTLAIVILVLLEGAHAAIQKRNVQIEQQRLAEPPPEPPPNLQINWGGIIYSSLYLSDDGVWSASIAPTWSDTAKFRFLAFRIKVSNPHIMGRKVGPAIGVSGQVEFSYDTGATGWSASPAAWVHDPSAKITVDVGREKELIVAVGAAEGHGGDS